MELLNIYGAIGALLIGIILGLTGGGGSILTVPIMVYVLHVNPITATAYSLFVVGTTSFVGTIRNAKKNLIEYKTALVFAIPSFLGVYFTRIYLLPSIPDILFTSNEFILTKALGIMLFLASLMLFASVSMIKSRKPVISDKKRLNYSLIIIEGFIVGLLTGIVGAGGGFLIIPALVLFANLPMKKAVATSLLIISVKSLFGFLGDIGITEIDWRFLLSFTSLSVAGILIGIWFNNFVNGQKLKKGFGIFVLVMAIFILFKELYIF